MSKSVLDMSSVTLDDSGRVLLSDDALIALESDADLMIAGGDSWNTWCSGGSNSCGNTFCGGTSNQSCTNTISCGNTSNSGACK